MRVLADRVVGRIQTFCLCVGNSGFACSHRRIAAIFVLLASSCLSAQTVTVTPSSLSFGSQALSITSTPKTATLKNGTTGSITISSISASGDYTQTSSCGVSLAAGANCTISVTFTPTATGSRAGVLTITDSAGNSPQTVSLTGTGVLQATVSPATLSFGSQAVATASVAKVITLKNNLPTALSISSIVAAGDYSQTNNCGTSLATSASCTVNVTFTPATTGSRTGTLTITDSASNSPQTVSLSGTGVVQAAVSPASLSFGNQVVGFASTAKSVTLTNNLPTVLTISSIAISGDYAQTNTCGTSLAAGTNCTISVAFTPTTTGNRTGTLTITDSANNSPQAVSLSGNGVVPVTVSPATLAFGSQAVTTTSAAKTVTVSNKQPTAVSISSITTPTAYAQSNTCGSSLAAQGTCTVSVTFSPATTGSQPGTLTITDSASNSPQTVNLTGTGTALPAITTLSTTSGTVGTSVTITGTGFGGSQGSSTVTFNGSVATPTTWKSTSIVVPVPTAATSGNVVVTVNSGQSNGVAFTVVPTITSLSAGSGIAGLAVTITGTGFGGAQGSSTVTFNGTSASPTGWSATSITASVPNGANAGTGSVIVTVGGTASNGAAFTVVPNIAGLSTTLGVIGSSVTVTGTGFGSNQGSSTVAFNGTAANATSWASGSITVSVPTGATSGNVVVTVNGIASAGVSFAVAPNITNLSAPSGIAGAVITISGTGFGSPQGTSTVTINGTVGSPTNWSAVSIMVPVPPAATGGSGNIVVTVGGTASNGATFGVVPNIASLSATSGSIGSPITITGTSFGPSQANSTVTFNGVPTTPTAWSNGSITAPVPPGATNGNVVVTVGGLPSGGLGFTVLGGAFVPTINQMTGAVYEHTATQLTTEQVLIVGGMSSSGVSGEAQLYNPTSQTFAAASPLNIPRWLHTATLLNDGTVLIAGGSSLANQTTLNLAEIYNPTSGTFTLLPSTLNTARVGHTATLLGNGQVLIVGGYDPTTGIIADAELYDPTAQVFIDLGNTNTPRFHHTATLLQSGQVLIAGGETDPTPSGAYNNAELFNPQTWIFSPVSASMISGREGHTASLFNDGTVLIAGGDLPGAGSLNTAEIYNPSAGTFTAVPATMTSPRIFHDAALLNGGKVLLSGGQSDSGGTSTALNTAELYDPIAQTFTSVAGSMNSVREHQTATLLNDGTVLEAGGTDGTNFFNTAELYSTSKLTGLASISISPASPSVPLGSQQLLIATGTFNGGGTQVLSSALWSSSSTSVANTSNDASDTGFAATVAQGTVTITASAAGISGSTTLTVPSPTLVSIVVNPPNPLVSLGTSQQLTATGLYSDGSAQDLTTTATWSSSAAFAAVNTTGLVTGLTQGISTIQAISGSQSGSTAVTVGPAVLISIALSPANASIALGSSEQYQVTGTYSDGSHQDITSSVEWSCSPCSAVYVGSSGLVSSVAQGTATIQAALGTVSGSAILTVTPASLSSLTISPSNLSIEVGGTQQLSATGTYTNYSSTDLTASSTWVSSNPNVATISATGYVTAIAAGATTITATTGSVSGTATLTVGTSTSATLNTSRYGQSATLLNNGMILIAGGISCPSAVSCSYLTSAELYDPDSATSSNTSSLATARSAPAMLLPNGKVLLAGGYSCDSGGNCGSLSTAEIFNMPYSYGYFTAGGNMTVARSGHTMTLLNNGRVLIAGGRNCVSATSCTTLNTAEIYDPVAGTFTPTGNLNAARYNAVAVALNQGLVLIVGGFDGSSYPAAAEIYDPTTGNFTPTANLYTPRANATATVLNTGQVLISGGSNCSTPGCPLSSAELYDPVAGTFTNTGSMNIARLNHSAVLLTSGEVLVAGGYSACATTCTSESTAETYDPNANTFSTVQALSTARSGQTATLVPSGDVVIAGGSTGGTTVSSIDFYQPSSLTPPGLTSITISPANPSVAGNMAQQFVALGSFSGGSTQTLRSATWASSNQSVTAVTNDGSDSGFVYSTTSGATVITATAGSVNGSTLLNTAPSLSYLSMSPGTLNLLAGQAQQFSVTGTYTDGSSKDFTSTAIWSSSNPTVAAMSSSTPGLSNTLAAGNTTILATLNGLTASASLVVDPATPTISNLSANSGSIGMAISIGGTDFGDYQGSGAVTFNSVPAQILSWTRVTIAAYVPANATSGPVQVTAAGVASNTINFTITQSIPTITAMSEVAGAIGDTITVSGSNFGTAGQVSFNGIAGSILSWSNTGIVTQIPAGAQTGPVTVISGGQTSNPITLTILTAPSVLSVSPSSGDVGTVVTISGANFTSPSIGPVVLFNGSAIQPTTWTTSQITVTVPMGTTSGPLIVKVGRLPSNPTTFSIVPTGSQSLSISPANATVFVGQTVNLSLSDNLEHHIAGAVWSLSNDTLAQLSSSNPPVLTATEPGVETVTATYNGLSASATITIDASGVVLPLGTVVCSLPASTSTFNVLKIMQAVPSDGTTPDLIAVEDDGAGSIWLRGLSSGCAQQWHTRVGSSASGSGVDQVVGETPDNLGGVVVSVTNPLSTSGNTNLSTSSLIRVEGLSGSPTWRYDSPGAFATDIAIDQNGYSLATENYLTDQFQENYTTSRLIKIDPNSGVPAANWSWPSTTITTIGGCTVQAGTATLAPSSSPISVDPDGSYYLTVTWTNSIYWPAPTLDSVNDCDDMTLAGSSATTSQLITISPSGGLSTTNLPNPANGRPIPDGNGGALVQIPVPPNQNQNQQGTQVMDIGGANRSATISNFNGGDMVLGDQGTYFTTDGNQIVNVNEASGNELWRWQPNSGTVEIIAATAGGGVAVKNIVGNQEDVVRLDASGNPTYDTWGTAGGSAGYGVVSKSSYWVNGQWVAAASNSVLGTISGDILDVATTNWPFGQSDPGSGGDRQGQGRSKLPEIVTFLPSHLSLPNDSANDVPAFYNSMLGNVQNRTSAAVPSRNNKQNDEGTLTGQIATADQTFFDGINGDATASTFLSYAAGPGKPLDAIAFIGHSEPPHLAEGAQQFSIGLQFYYPKSKYADCSTNLNPGDPGTSQDAKAPWDIEYLLAFGMPPAILIQYFSCEPNWGDHKLVALEEDATKVTGLNPKWQYSNSIWTRANDSAQYPTGHPQLLVSKLAPQAKIMFFAACELFPTFTQKGEVPPFIQMWDVHDPKLDGAQETRVRAIVVPNFSNSDSVLLGDGANEWTQILKNLVSGQNIQTAVDNANSTTGLNWQVFGNHNVTIREKK